VPPFPALQESINKRIAVHAAIPAMQENIADLCINIDIVQKVAKAKRAGGMVQMVECLPSKYKAPSSNCSTTPQKRIFLVIPAPVSVD
jgi:hypothetical protein